jgi:glycosyltransferase involved in cell wall biosynthesis
MIVNTKLISVVTGCRNEEGNLRELYERIRAVFSKLPGYDFELIVADNDSRDRSREILRGLCAADPRVKAIFNNRNFGPERSGGNAILQVSGVAVVCMAADLQNPPEMIEQFVRKWEEGFKIVAAIKTRSEESFLFSRARNFYYDLVRAIAYAPPLKNWTGFGIYDRGIIENIRKMADPDPFFRGAVTEFGYSVYPIEFTQPARKRGFSKYNVLSLVDHGILGLISQTRVPLRLATLSGFCCSALSFLIGLWYLVYKLIYWKEFSVGVAPVVVGIFFFASVQLFFVGILGEYIGAIYTKVSGRLLVVEKERVNF